MYTNQLISKAHSEGIAQHFPQKNISDLPEVAQGFLNRITDNTEDLDLAEVTGEYSQREVHQFRASLDLMKTLPTGMGAVLIAHGEDTEAGASSVFRKKSPRLE